MADLSSPEAIAFRLRNLAQNMAAGSEPVARDHQAWTRVEEIAEAVAALRAAPEGFVLVPVELTDSMHDAGLFAPLGENSSDFVHASWAAMLAARPQGVR